MPGREGDLGIEVLYSPKNDVLMIKLIGSALVVMSFIPDRLTKDHKVRVEKLGALEQR